ncbi:signal peptidase I [Paenibacillus lutrae]|uniref:Signal peptidase I n=1 Tax=Paenibacillus lutrae TaxID=2078573 RepID=A0A7X3FK18_9BACL|nr:signal peptidase I [Paenibacillus lutrae]MVP01053.1 signal peptidase I [Paenibacillus lutrae]
MEQIETKTPAPTKKNEVWEWTRAILIAVICVVVVRWFLFAPFIINGDSMEPNFSEDEKLIVNKVLYNFAEPKRGEVIIFHANEREDYIKRIVALPGEKVKVEGDQVYINGEPLDEPYLKEAVASAAASGKTYNNLNYPEQTVPEGTVFVLGDNRPGSKDSRSSSIGFIRNDTIIGRADLAFWPLGKFGLISHE